MSLGWLLLIFTAVIAILIVAFNAYYRFLLKRMVRGKLDDITAIYDTWLPPWRKDGECEQGDVKRLALLIKYLKKTRLVVDEQTRGEVLERLQEVRAVWSQRAKKKESGSA